MKTNEEPNVRKEEVKAEKKQRRMLQDEELEQVVGGGANFFWIITRMRSWKCKLLQVFLFGQGSCVGICDIRIDGERGQLVPGCCRSQ